MHTCIYLWLLFIMLAACAPPPLPTALEAFPHGAIRIGVDPTLPPFALLTETDLFGLDIDIGREISGRVGLPARFVVLGYDSLYDVLIADDATVDVVISALLTDPARTGDVLYTRHYFNNGLVLVSPEAKPLDSMRATAGRSLAYEFGSSADAEARAWLRRIAPFATQPYELPVYALDAVRLDVADSALVEATAARLYLREHPEWAAQVIYVTDAWYAAAVSHQHPDMWMLINIALQSMADDGTLEMLLDKWL